MLEVMNRTALLITLAVFGLAGLATAAVFLLPGERDWSDRWARPSVTAHGEPGHDHARDHRASGLRTVYVHDHPTTPSRPGEPLSAELVRGKLHGATTATVITDENCQPDAAGVSHCINRLRARGGVRVVVRHNHRMHEVPCLVPGEQVELRAA
jgi:hypothetical protein